MKHGILHLEDVIGQVLGHGNNGSYSSGIASGGSMTNCYYNSGLFRPTADVSDPRWSTGRLTGEQFANRASFKNWDFDNVWIMTEEGYPELRIFLDNEEITRLEGLPINGGTYSLTSVTPIGLSGVGDRNDCLRAYAIDGDESTCWYGNTYGKADYNFNFTFDKAYRFFCFSIVGGNPESVPCGNGYHYVLYGGNDSADGDTGWTELYRCDQTGEIARFGEFRGDDLCIYKSNNISYKYLRLVMGPNDAGKFIPTLREISFKTY